MTPYLQRPPGIFLLAAACGTMAVSRLYGYYYLRFYFSYWNVALIVACFGLWTAGAIYLNINLTCGIEKFSQRCLRCGLWIVVTAAVVYFSVSSGADYFPSEAFNFVPFACLATQLPFWIARYLLRLRIVRCGETVELDRWSLKDYAVGTIIFAATMVTIRPAIQGDPTMLLPPMVFFSAMPALLILPPSYYLLRIVSPRSAFIAFLLNLAALGVFLIAVALSRRLHWYMFRELSTVLVTMFLGGCTGILCLRREGYRLLVGSETSVRTEPVATVAGPPK